MERDVPSAYESLGFKRCGEVVDVNQERIDGNDLCSVLVRIADKSVIPQATQAGLEDGLPWQVLVYIAWPQRSKSGS